MGFTGAAPVSNIRRTRPHASLLPYSHLQGVELRAYRVADCLGQANDSTVAQGIMRAYEEGADIITASLGWPDKWYVEPKGVAMAVSRIIESGVPCTVSTGNEGFFGLFFTGAPTSEHGVMSVASFDNTVTPKLEFTLQYSVDGREQREFNLTSGTPADWSDAPANMSLFAHLSDANGQGGGCSLFPADTPDLSESIVLIPPGACSFSQMTAHAAAFGAKFIISWKTEPGTSMQKHVANGIIASGMVS